MQIMRAVAICLLVQAASAWAAPPSTLTLDEAIRIARAHHPSVEATAAQLDAARARRSAALSSFLPGLTGYFAYQPQTPNFALSPGFKRLLAQPGASSMAMQMLPPTYQLFDYWTAGIGLYFTAFDWGRTIYGYRAARRAVSAVEESARANRADVTLNVELAYYGAIAADAAVAVAVEAVSTQQQHLAEARAFLQVGSRTQIDVASAESDLAAAELTQARAEGGREAARAQLSAAIGSGTWDDAVLVVPPEPADAPLSGETSLASEALKARPEPEAFRLQAGSLADSARAVRGNYLPALVLQLGPSWAGTELTSLTTNISISLALSFPLTGLNPFQVHAAVREAQANTRVALAQERAEENQVRLETAQARAGLVAARQAVVAAQKLEKAARERRDLAEGRYQTGVGSILELSDAQLNYVNAEFQVVQARLNRAQAGAQLDHALGRL